MGKHIKLSTKQFQFLYSYPAYSENRQQQQEQKLPLLAKASAAYGDAFYNLKESTRKAVEMICWFAAEKGYCFAKEDYLCDRFGISPRTVRDIFKVLRKAGVIITVYRHSTRQNGLGAPVHFFADHPLYETWKDAFTLPDCQAGCQAEKTEIPCQSKDEQSKKVSTKYLSLSKKLFKILRKKTRLDESFTPKNVPVDFIKAVKPFFGEAKEIHTLWQKAEIASRPFTLLRDLKEYTDLVTDAFKQSVYALKHRKIKKDFHAYFYGTLMNMFTYQKRRETFATHPVIYNWVNDEDLPY